jgi:hypothetical protein
VRAAGLERARRNKDRTAVGKRMATEENSLERLRAKLHEVHIYSLHYTYLLLVFMYICKDV